MAIAAGKLKHLRKSGRFGEIGDVILFSQLLEATQVASLFAKEVLVDWAAWPD